MLKNVPRVSMVYGETSLAVMHGLIKELVSPK